MITYCSLDLFNGPETITFLSNNDSLFELDFSILFGVGALKPFNNETNLFHVINGLAIVFHFEVTFRDESDGFDIIDFEL